MVLVIYSNNYDYFLWVLLPDPTLSRKGLFSHLLLYNGPANHRALWSEAQPLPSSFGRADFLSLVSAFVLARITLQEFHAAEEYASAFGRQPRRRVLFLLSDSLLSLRPRSSSIAIIPKRTTWARSECTPVLSCRVSSDGLLGMINFFIFQACKLEMSTLHVLTAETPLPVLIYVHYVSESVSVVLLGVGGHRARQT
jgi:hypothetical protein